MPRAHPAVLDQDCSISGTLNPFLLNYKLKWLTSSVKLSLKNSSLSLPLWLLRWPHGPRHELSAFQVIFFKFSSRLLDAWSAGWLLTLSIGACESASSHDAHPHMLLQVIIVELTTIEDSALLVDNVFATLIFVRKKVLPPSSGDFKCWPIFLTEETLSRWAFLSI